MVTSKSLTGRAAIILGGFAGSVAACQILAGIAPPDLVSPEAGAPDALIEDAGPAEAAEAAPAKCGESVPERTYSPDGKAQGLVVIALHHLFLDRDGGRLGFDLDCTDSTCANGVAKAASCTPPAGAKTACDEPGAIDNQLRKVATDQLGAAVDFDIDRFGVEQGVRTVLVVILGYNGQDDDPEVKVAIVPSLGLYESCLDDGGAPDGGTLKPTWQGCDRWSPDSRFAALVPGSTKPGPKFYAKGYVVGRKLVVPQEQTPPVAFNFPFGKSVLQIDSPALVARLESTVPTNGGAVTYRLRDGVVGGFVSAHNMLAQVAEFTVVDGGCDLGNGLFTFARANLCGLQDVALTPDGGACNGFSAGVGFEADPAEFGMLRDPDLFDSGCSADLLKCP